MWVEIDFPLFGHFQHKLVKIKHKISENCLQNSRNLLCDFHRFMTETTVISWTNSGRPKVGAAVKCAVLVVIEFQVELHVVRACCY
jgi:hypothetical protein